MLDFLISLVYPRRCAICNEIVIPRKLKACPSCKKKLHYITEPACLKCGRQIENPQAQYCHACRNKKQVYHRGYAVWQYDDAIRHSLSAYKYHARKDYAAFYAQEAVNRLSKAVLAEKPDVLIPVPIHKSRRRERGFNQAEILAKKIGKELSIPVDCSHLIRIRKTRALKTLDARQREQELKGAFSFVRDPGDKPVYRCVMLVDDIYTTGNTINRCSEALLSAGVERVTFLCVAIGSDT